MDISIGTKAVRNRAYHKLKCERIDKTSWRVWGGETEHIVTMLEDGCFKCDCAADQRGIVCSHKVRVGIEFTPEVFISDLEPIWGRPPIYRTVKSILKKNKFRRGDLGRYKEALEFMYARKNYPPEIQEIVAEHVYKYLSSTIRNGVRK